MRNIIVGFMIFVVALAAVCHADPDRAAESTHKGFSRDTIMAGLEQVKPQIKEKLAATLVRLEAADSEISALVKRKGSKRIESHFWCVGEKSTDANGVVTMLQVDFLSETGPVHLGSKRVFKDRTYQEELKDQGYDVYYHENGTVKKYIPRGSLYTILTLYPSGKISNFSIDDGVEVFVDLSCGEDGSIKREKVNGEQKASKQ